MNIYFVQETEWKGEKAREFDEEYKIIYSGNTSTRNGVRMILNEERKISRGD